MMQCQWPDTMFPGDGCTVHKLYNVVFQTVPRNAPMEKLATKATKPFSPGTFFGMAKSKPKPKEVVQPKLSLVKKPVQAVKQKEVVTPFQVITPKRPLLQPKFSVTYSSKPDLHVQPGWFIPSESELVSLKSNENAHDLMERYLPEYEDKKQAM